mmetsp:Transcript_26506/g.44378  ORF Transcript_26506/g.44378 Transcript_26506/m.44378 type:complete len:136 (+) Transcript_26506:431-838(+)
MGCRVSLPQEGQVRRQRSNRVKNESEDVNVDETRSCASRTSMMAFNASRRSSIMSFTLEEVSTKELDQMFPKEANCRTIAQWLFTSNPDPYELEDLDGEPSKEEPQQEQDVEAVKSEKQRVSRMRAKRLMKRNST